MYNDIIAQAQKAKRDFCLSYLASGRSSFRAPKMLHYTVDGVRAAGDDNEIFVAWLPERNLAGVAPIQAMPKRDFTASYLHHHLMKAYPLSFEKSFIYL